MKLFLLALLSLVGLGGFAQSSINSAGTTIQNGTHQLDFSLGILSAQILESDSSSISPGTIQPGSKSGTGILELVSSEFQIYPNPATESFSISGRSGQFNFSIQDALGRQIQSSQLNSNEQVNITHLPNGYYTVIIENHSFKFLKTN